MGGQGFGFRIVESVHDHHVQDPHQHDRERQFRYLDPEYYRRQQLTVKSDVYSFGVVLCEVLCARPAVVHAAEKRQMNLAEWTKSCHRDGELDQIIDPNMKGEIETDCLNKFVEIAMSCISDSGIERPSMDDVVRGLCLHCNYIRTTVKGTTMKPLLAYQVAL
ncbi:hypothetical protein DVH24_006195 [Malus domestica]|uniref:Serine-threonine/tyrosine-protein kinase catalytic domain-containing protein n=1 Tax=Malus domestica TaxID=3750 RepID=A0A498KNZ2_MALDO|nr:hypothetical protein DVH24_006195 [Malus domestica]